MPIDPAGDGGNTPIEARARGCGCLREGRMDPLSLRAKAHFGTTRDPRETGFILSDGSRLDFSGRHGLGPNQRSGDWLRGRRGADHREVADLIDEPVASGSRAMRLFMARTGAVRFHPGAGFDCVAMPNARQIATAVACHRATAAGDPLHVDVTDPDTGENVASREFRGARDLAALISFLEDAFSPSRDPSPN